MSPWPLPRSFTSGSECLWLAEDVRLDFFVAPASLERLRYKSTINSQEANADNYRLNKDTFEHGLPDFTGRLSAAFERVKSRIFAESLVLNSYYPHKDFREPAVDEPKTHIRQVSLNIETVLSQVTANLTQKEAYQLDVSSDGRVFIIISSFEGGIWALETFAQLFFEHSEVSRKVYIPNVPIHIQDEPLFTHRGLNLDISRNRIFPADVIRTIDAMSMSKMNRLHIHATDSQSWPIEIPALPDLATKGAYHRTQVWSTSDLAKVQSHGKDRGVEVFLEIDMPGHTSSIYHAYPDLIAAYDMRPWGPWAAEPPSGQLKLNSPEVFKFLDTLLGDILPRVSPFTSYMHIGGDEVNMKAFELDETVSSSSPDVILPLLQKFFDHVFAKIETFGRTPVAWEEIVLEYHMNVPKNTIVQSWRSQESLAKLVAKGYKALFGPRQSWYLDAGFGSWMEADPKNPNSSIKRPFLDWNGPFKSWRQVYTYDPFDQIPEENRELIVGGEVHLWCEQTDNITLDFKLWPRVAAAAEVLWKGPMKVDESVTRRLAQLRERLVLHGLRAEVVQMEWCLKNEGGCLL
jgi:hexosaminidase